MIDLHCHSNISDGALPPAEVVKLAAENGCTMLALTDHDHTGGLPEARKAAEMHGIRLINGVEISVTWRGRGVHIVGLDFDEDCEILQSLLASVRTGRLERLEKIAAKFDKIGIRGVYEGALSLAANPEMVSRTHIAEFLIREGLVRNKQQAFTKYLGGGKAAFVQHEWAALPDCVHAIKAASGLAVVAHPMRYDMSATAKRNLFEEFKALGGDGIEVHSGNCDHNDCLNYLHLAKRFGLLASIGSDFHRQGDYSGGIVGKTTTLPENTPTVWQYFRKQ